MIVEMSGPIKKCPHGGLPEFTQPWTPHPGYSYIALRCKKQFCFEGDYNCPITEYFPDTEKGREMAVHAWNRMVDRKTKELGG